MVVELSEFFWQWGAVLLAEQEQVQQKRQPLSAEYGVLVPCAVDLLPVRTAVRQ